MVPGVHPGVPLFLGGVLAVVVVVLSQTCNGRYKM